MLPLPVILSRVPQPKPAYWLPFTDSLELADKSTVKTVAAQGIGFTPWNSGGLVLQEGGGARVSGTIVSSTKGVDLTSWSIPYPLFTIAHTFDGVNYPAGDITVTLWAKLEKETMQTIYGSKPYVAKVVNGCVLDSGTMYKDGVALTPEQNCVYVHNEAEEEYWWDGAQYVQLTYPYNSLIMGTPDSFEYFGMLAEVEYTDFIAVMPLFCNRNSGQPNNITNRFVPFVMDTWVFLSFSVRAADKHVITYFNDGIHDIHYEQISDQPLINWMWAFQPPSWTMFGNYHAVRLPFVYRDVRIWDNVAMTLRDMQRIYSKGYTN